MFEGDRVKYLENAIETIAYNLVTYPGQETVLLLASEY